MGARGERDSTGDDTHDIVVVPHRPGPLITPGARRGRERDDLDDLIDELVPEVDEGPGVFDAVLVATGAGLLVWAALGDAPAMVAAAGAAALALGAVLPVRTAWRRLRRRRDGRRRAAVLGRGVPLDVSSPHLAALAASYRDLVELADATSPAVATPVVSAAHAALSEVATLLGGRVPVSDREVAYVDARAAALTELAGALRTLARAPSSGPEATDTQPAVTPEAVLRAREEVDEIAASSSVARLDELTAELRDRDHGWG